MKSFVLALLLALTALPAIAQTAALELNNGGNRIIVLVTGEYTFSNPCNGCSVSPPQILQPGFIHIDEITLGGFKVDGINAVTYPAITNEIVFQDLVFSREQADDTLNVKWSSVGFHRTLTNSLKPIVLTCEGFSDLDNGRGNISCAGYTGHSVLFDQSWLVGTLGPFFGYFSQQQTWGPAAHEDPYSMEVGQTYFVPAVAEAGGGAIQFAPGITPQQMKANAEFLASHGWRTFSH